VTTAEETAEEVVARTHPIVIIREALAWAEKAGIQVAFGPIGVAYSEKRRAWVQGDASHPVSPLGAVLLKVQPRPDDTVEQAVASVFESPSGYVEGFVCGSDHMEPDGKWMLKSSLATRAYLMGITHGAQFRVEMSVRCARHQTIRVLGQSCEGCVRDGVS
jgi:hypothetical protein